MDLGAKASLLLDLGVVSLRLVDLQPKLEQREHLLTLKVKLPSRALIRFEPSNALLRFEPSNALLPPLFSAPTLS